MKPRVYLAGPITGLTYEDSEDWRKVASCRLRLAGIEAYSPMRGKEHLRGIGVLADQYHTDAACTGKGIVTRDYWDVRNAGVVLVNVLGAERVSIGTVMEIAWAHAHRVPVVLVMEPGNVHDHQMLTECSGFVVDNLDDGIRLVTGVLNP